MVRVFRIMRVSALCLGPGNDFADVLDEGLAFGDILHGEHALAVDAGTTGLNAAIGFGGQFLGHVGKIW
jgi:hypothetical protein